MVRKIAIFLLLVSMEVFASVTLSWVPPTEREDGTPLLDNEICCYRIYWGTTPGNYINQIDIDGAVDSYSDITEFPPNIIYLVLTTIDTDGRESMYSSELVLDNSVENLILLPMSNATFRGI